ncbi:hypothetical protein ACIBQX_46815 [Nonomuraea sp. NPDC049714]
MKQPYCLRCLGSGTIIAYRSHPHPTGQTLVIETTETCPTCRGKGTR